LPVEKIIGVELDPLHVKIAKQHFGVLQPNVELIVADAIKWVESYHGPKFDVVIEDLFTDVQDEAMRVVETSEQWFRSLRHVLQPDGALIINFEDTAQFRSSGAAYLAAIDGGVDCRFGFTLPTYGNCIGAFLPTVAKAGQLRIRLDALLRQYPASRENAQKFRMRRVSAK